jgi:hypothetical protein
MANFAMTGKSGSEWTSHELRSLNIRVEDQSLQEFFGLDTLPDIPNSVAHFSELDERTLAPDDGTYKLMHYLDLAHRQDDAVWPFVARLLETMGYTSGHRLAVSKQELPLLFCGLRTSAKAEVCVIDDENDILLLVQTDTRLDQVKDDLEPQVIASAIAAFQRNNALRKTELAIPELPSIRFPAIVFQGTTPSFYQIRISKELNDAVVGGYRPELVTVVARHTPRVPQRRSFGMKPLDSRQQLLRYLQAFKHLYERLLL